MQQWNTYARNNVLWMEFEADLVWGTHVYVLTIGLLTQ